MDTLRVLHCCSSSTATSASKTSSQNHCPRQFKFLSHHQRHATLTFIRPSIFQTPGFADRSAALRRHSSPILCGVSSVQTREEEKMGKKKAQGKVRLSVRLDHQVQFGDHVAVLGSTKELGSWKKQVAMKWTEDGWVCAVELEGGDSVEYKFVIVRKNKKVVWESGDNRVMKLPKGGSFAIICHWDMTGEAVDLLPLDLEQNVEGVEYVGDNGSAATDVVVGTSSFVEQWQGKAASFMRSNEHHNREADRKWDTSGLEGLAVKLVEGDRNGRNWWRKVEPNQEFQGLVCEGANVLPTKFIEDSFRDGYGKVVNIRRLDEVIDSINGWYMERGLFGLVSGVEILSGGIIRLQVSEAEVNNISIRFLDRKTGEPTVGKTKPETILRQLTTKKGQVYSMLQGKRDVDTVLTMGIMEDVSIVPQPAGDTGKVDLTMNVVERVSGGFSAGGGISSGITSGPLSGLIGSFAYSHRNVFGRNQKLNVSLERGQIDSIFRINYTDPWIEGDDKRTSRSIMIQNSRTPGTLVHGNQPDNSSLTIGRVTAGIEFSRPFRPKWSGTAGLIFQHAGARDDKGNPIIKDFYSSPLTASGNTHDDTLLAKFECVYTGSGDPGSSMFVFNMEQGLPVLPEWLFFNRVNARARKGLDIGPARFLLSLSGGHVVGNFSPHEAFAIGGTNSVRGYEEGAVGSGRSYVVGSGEIAFPLLGPVEGAIFADYGTDLGSGPTVPGDPAGARLKPGSGYGYGCGVRVDSPLGPLRLEYAFDDRKAGRFHFGVGHRN